MDLKKRSAPIDLRFVYQTDDSRLSPDKLLDQFFPLIVLSLTSNVLTKACTV